MYIMCVCLFGALSRRVGALQLSIIIISKIEENERFWLGEIVCCTLLSRKFTIFFDRKGLN